MKKYVSLLKYEMKTMFKESTNKMLLFYPLIMLAMLGLVVPAVIKKMDNPSSISTISLITLAVALAIGAYVVGAMLGFTLIENKDEKTILSIAVTPIEVKGYAFFKIIYTYLFAIIGNMIIVGGLKLIANDAYVMGTIRLLDNLSWLYVLVFSLVNSLLVPTVALIMASFAKNKIEGFAFIKSSGFIIMIPVLTLLNFFSGVKQYLLGIAPNFWPIKAMLNVAMQNTESSNLPYYIYMLIGAIYLILISFLALNLFIKRLNLNQ